MNAIQLILCVFCPPLAVVGCGCSAVALVFVLTMINWMLGTMVALILCCATPQ